MAEIRTCSDFGRLLYNSSSYAVPITLESNATKPDLQHVKNKVVKTNYQNIKSRSLKSHDLFYLLRIKKCQVFTILLRLKEKIAIHMFLTKTC